MSDFLVAGSTDRNGPARGVTRKRNIFGDAAHTEHLTTFPAVELSIQGKGINKMKYISNIQ